MVGDMQLGIFFCNKKKKKEKLGIYLDCFLSMFGMPYFQKQLKI